jgi:CDGSH iron-sulfur domain-containing protein 3
VGDLKIQARLNGPYLVPGPLSIKDESGEVKRVDRESVSLCRCGGSKDKPLCDGTHRSNGFVAPAATLESD